LKKPIAEIEIPARRVNKLIPQMFPPFSITSAQALIHIEMFVLHNYIGALVWHFMLAFYGPMVNFM